MEAIIIYCETVRVLFVIYYQTETQNKNDMNTVFFICNISYKIIKNYIYK